MAALFLCTLSKVNVSAAASVARRVPGFQLAKIS